MDLGAADLQVREKALNGQKEWVGGEDWRLPPAPGRRGVWGLAADLFPPGAPQVPLLPWLELRQGQWNFLGLGNLEDGILDLKITRGRNHS